MSERRLITSCNTVVLTSAGMGRANGSHTERNVRERTLVCSAMIQFSKQKLIRSNHHPATTLKRLLGCIDAGRSCDQAIEHVWVSLYSSLSFPSNNLVRSSNENDATTGLGDFAFSFLADIAGLDDNGNVGKAAFAEDFGVSESEKVDDGGGVLRSAFSEVLILGCLGKQAPKL